MKKKVTYNAEYKTVIFDYDGTMFDTEIMQQYVGNTKKYPRFSPQWVAARKEYISHIVDVKPYDGWADVWKFLRENNIKAAIVSGNNREVLNVATKHFGLRDIFPKEKVNRIGCRDVNGKVVRKRGGNPTLFKFALSQLEESGDNVLAFGNEPCDSVAASKCGITAYNCLWGATDEDREVMQNDREHVCLSDPRQIIYILKSTSVGLGVSHDAKPSNTVKSSIEPKKVSKRKYPTAKSDRAENDYYATDPLAAHLLLEREGFSQNVWECASGENHLADVFRHYGYTVRTSDIVKRTPTTEVLDFLDCNVQHWDGDIITNPPYTNAQEFVEKALSVVSEGQKVAMFLRLQFLEGLHRYDLFKENPPKVVYVSSKRIRCGKEGEFNTSSSSIIAYAWFVWEKGYKGGTSIEWINHGENVDEEKVRANIKRTEAKTLPLCASDLLSERRRMKVRNRKGKKFNLFIQRVECSVYEKCGFNRYHYIDKPINKAAASYLTTDAKGNPIAFIAFLNCTFKGCSNGLMVSRFVILPKYRGKGLSMPILSKACGMLKAKNKRVFINTENPILGKALNRSKNFKGTTFDQKHRESEYDVKYAHRRGGYAWRKEYCGFAVYGYGSIMKKLAVMREKRKNLNLGDHAENRKPMCVKYHIGMYVHERSSCHVVNRAVVGCDCVSWDAVDGSCIKALCRSIGGRYEKVANGSGYEYVNTS